MSAKGLNRRRDKRWMLPILRWYHATLGAMGIGTHAAKAAALARPAKMSRRREKWLAEHGK